MTIMNATIQLTERTKNHFLGTRFSAQPLRQELEDMFADNRQVTIDFKAMSVTQSFVDELIGSIVLKNGPDMLQRISFSGCSEDVKAIIQFVIGRRLTDYNNSHQH